MILWIIISVQHRTPEFQDRFAGSAAPIWRFLFTFCFCHMVQRWHDETDHGRNSEHYHENALAVNIAICVPSLCILLAFHGLYYYRS